jgi:hypothetical protein
LQFSLSDMAAPNSGRFQLRVFRRGLLVDLVDEPNLIVTGSKFIHAQLLGGAVTNNSVTTIGFGTSGTAPVVGNTSLTAPYTKALDSVSYPASNEVSFNFSLGSSEDNGVGIFEFGLFTAGGLMYARKTRTAALNKDTDISLTGSWIISF